MRQEKIGIFDSGIGGLSILKVLLDSEYSNFVYAADTAYLPYGEKSPEILIERGHIITQLFLKHNITTIIVACHTSSATTLPTLQKAYPHLTFIDMLLPTITAACNTTKNNLIGVFATAATIKSGLHKKLLQEHNHNITIIEKACPLLVPLIENENSTTQEIEKILQDYLAPIIAAKADTLILGCTHYAFLKEHLKKLAPQLQLVCADQEAALRFTSSPEANNKRVTFLVSGDKAFFKHKSGKKLPDHFDYSFESF
jgi:glutamate racemase